MIRFLGVYDYTVILTYVSLFSAVLGMVEAFSGNYGIAVCCVLFSGICDAFDGAVARTKKNRTEEEKCFGIQIDSLCDLICFGVTPAVICYMMGVNGVFGVLLNFFYILCALIRLAFFNVLEEKRQQTQGGSNKVYRGLPVTSISMVFPVVYVLKFFVFETLIIFYLMLSIVGFLFILDFKVKKPNWDRLLKR